MIIFIMVGCPGSGKSYKAKQLAKDYNAKICSADDFHEWWGNGEYLWSSRNNSFAHSQCRLRFDCCVAYRQNVIIDNTNSKYQDFKYYLDVALSQNITVWLVEPDTDWKYDAEACFAKNQHNVPLETIKRMIENIKSDNMVTLLGEYGK